MSLLNTKHDHLLGTVHRSQAAAQPTEDKPFILPFKEQPGPGTWLLGQTYGNTTGAYRQRDTTYGASQGIHFGIDFSAPCGTELVAIADGVILATDALSAAAQVCCGSSSRSPTFTSTCGSGAEDGAARA